MLNLKQNHLIFSFGQIGLSTGCRFPRDFGLPCAPISDSDEHVHRMQQNQGFSRRDPYEKDTCSFLSLRVKGAVVRDIYKDHRLIGIGTPSHNRRFPLLKLWMINGVAKFTSLVRAGE